MPLLGIKDLDQLPPCILRFHLRLHRFSYDIIHVPGKELYTADTLSRVPVPREISIGTTDLQELAELCLGNVISHLLTGGQRLGSYRKHSLKILYANNS